MTIAQLLIGKTVNERVRILNRILERLRLRHNAMGDDFRNGVITEAEWKTFLQVWEPRFQRVCNILNVIRDNQGFFITTNLETYRILKEEGKVLTTYDADIDIETV